MVPIRVRLREILRCRLFPFGLRFLEKIEALAARPSAPPASPSFRHKDKTALALLSGLGGGADKQTFVDVDTLTNNGYTVSLLKFQVLRRRFVLFPKGLNGEREYFYVPFGLGALWKRIDDLGISEVRVHSLRYWPQYVAQALPAYFTARHMSVTAFCYDFYYICPRIHLVTGAYEFCGLPSDPKQCNSCVKASGQYVNMQGDASAWRGQNLRLLQAAQSIIAPSQDTFNQYQKIFPGLKLTLAPFGTLPDAPARIPAPHGESVSIAIVGNLLRHKGADIVLAAARYIKSQGLPVTLTVIGDSIYAPEFSEAEVKVTGKYAQADLADLLAQHKADYVWVTSTCPETYCLVLDEVAAIGYPLIVFGIGAQGERVKDRASPADVIIPYGLLQDPPALCNLLAALRATAERLSA